MNQILKIELSESTFAVIQRQAEAAGISPTNFVRELLEKQLARERFESHFGEVNLGYSTGVDNNCIDEDLARAYTDTHE